MEITYRLNVACREEWRTWLEENHDNQKECWLILTKNDQGNTNMEYIDAVEEALCFGWVDSTCKSLGKGARAQRFSPRKKKSNWTELNKERVRRLIRLEKMTEAGYATLPDLDEPFVVSDEIMQEIKKDNSTYQTFLQLPSLYIRIKIDNVQNCGDSALYAKRLLKFLESITQNKMYGEWDDGGRLSEL